MRNLVALMWSFIHVVAVNATDIESVFIATKNQNYTAAMKLAAEFEEEELKNALEHLLQLQMTRKSNSIAVSNQTNSNSIAFVNQLILGYQNAYASQSNSLAAYKHFSEALKMSEKIGNTHLIKAALISLLDLFSIEIFIGSKQYEPYLERFTELKTDNTDEALIILYNLVFFTKANDEIDEVDTRYYSYFEKLDSLFTKFPMSNNLLSKYYLEKGMYYKIEQDSKKAEDFFLKADSIAALSPHLKHLRSIVAWQIAAVNYENNNLFKAKSYLKASQGLSKTLKDTFYLDKLKSLIFQKEDTYDSAYHYLRKSVDAEYKLGYKNNTLESSILTVQNQTDRLKLEKLALDAQRRKNRNWAAFLGILLLLGSIIGYLVQSNTKRKQLVAEQQQKLQEQKVASLLKEQELTTIDAMIEGQGKERQRIANDLHDDLGGLMATVKLHFNALHASVTNDKDDMYEKTNMLLDEAYEKIRAITHAKHSGVIAKQGLLKAIKHMAHKISAANKVSVKVQDFGLDNRLENSLELTLFRMVQELITNAIKHARAKTINIHLTNHGDTLNILVEDNGIGFNAAEKLAMNSTGMGLKSIDKRVTHLDGTMHIESEPGKGATVILDIPI